MKSGIFCVKKCKYSTIFTSETMKWIKHTVVLDVGSVACHEAFLIEQGVLFLAYL